MPAMNVLKRALMAGVASVGLFAVAAAPAHTLIPTGWAGGHQSVSVVNPTYGGEAGGFAGTWDGNAIQFWCYELGQSFTFNHSYTDYSLGTPTNEDLLSKLFQEAYAHALDDAQHSAAFQLAIWEILYDSDLNLFSGMGTFHTTRTANATDLLAQSWLDGLAGFSDNGDIVLYHSADHQDFIGRKPPGDLPEPAPLALIGLGVVAMLVAKRRRGDGEPRA